MNILSPFRGRPKGGAGRLLILAIAILTATTTPPPTRAQSADELTQQAHAALNEGRTEEALTLADKAVAAAPRSANARFVRAHIYETLKRYDKAIADYTALLKIVPNATRVRDRRGDAYLKDGQMDKAIADFDAAIEASPGLEPHHWRRGIAYYYAGQFKKGVEQFELHKTVNGDDVENTVWHFLCNARLKGVEKARAELIPLENADARVPMMAVLDLFAGKATPEDVLAAAEAADGPQSEPALFYAHLYLGLYREALGEHEKARKNLETAATEHTSRYYMGDVARVHVKLLNQKREDADEQAAPQP